tara:strand:- start:721 stop:954 length:234 start_codon:yes stop_codon:yes gene_type:complete
MTLTEFNILSFQNKYSIAIENGLFLYNYITEDGGYECYSFEDFSVEIIYNNDNTIIKIVSYKEDGETNEFSGKIILI